jgi:hypothetical protein
LLSSTCFLLVFQTNPFQTDDSRNFRKGNEAQGTPRVFMVSRPKAKWSRAVVNHDPYGFKIFLEGNRWREDKL